MSTLSDRCKQYHLSENIIAKIEKPSNIISNTHPNVFFDRIFIINLDRSKDRWNHITKNLLQFGITNFERQPGIYLPRKDPLDILPTEFYQNLEAYGGRFRFDPDYILNSVGTNLAHYAIVEKAIRRNYRRILVLEDDVFLNKNFLNPFSNAVSTINRLNHEWHLIYLGFKKSRPSFSGKHISPELMVPKQFIRGAYGYALNFPSFPIITKMKLYGGMEIDAFFEFVMCRHGKVLCFNPPIIGHRDNMVSTITNAKWKSRKF